MSSELGIARQRLTVVRHKVITQSNIKVGRASPVSPRIYGNDLEALSPEELNLMTEVVRVSQATVKEEYGRMVWV